tara:strand:- start:630 stop:1319 length:690 start_codon:yes stop_codon:yes gene_type:complete
MALVRASSRTASRSLSSVSAGSSVVDSLLGLTFKLRLQTHIGDGVPVGLYQDIAKTIPATLEGDPIAVWADELSASGQEVIQANASLQPTLSFDSGLPFVDFAGGKYLRKATPSWSNESGLTAAMSCKLPTGGVNLYDAAFGGNSTAFIHGFASINGSNMTWFTGPQVNFGAVDDTWQTFSTASGSTSTGALGIGSDNIGTKKSSGKYKALIMGEGADVVAIQAHIETL